MLTKGVVAFVFLLLSILIWDHPLFNSSLGWLISMVNKSSSAGITLAEIVYFLSGVGIWTQSGGGSDSVVGFGMSNTYNPAVSQEGSILVAAYAA
jgi:hypothetical protein